MANPGEDGVTQNGPAFVRVRRVRSFDDVVEQVRRSIAEGEIGVGERLPSERELAEQFGVSRATLREALRALEALGILEIRLGAHGGAFALGQSGDQLTAAFRDIFAAEAALRPADTHQFRATFHADNATWARVTERDATDLASGAEEGERSFLLALARSTQAPVRFALAETLETTRIPADGPEPLAKEDMQEVVDLLLNDRRIEAHELVYRLLAGDVPREPAP